MIEGLGQGSTSVSGVRIYIEFDVMESLIGSSHFHNSEIHVYFLAYLLNSSMPIFLFLVNLLECIYSDMLINFLLF